MEFMICGLGNPGQEYAGTRHNTGAMAVEYFAKKSADFESDGEWKSDKKLGALIGKGKLGKHTVKLILPQLFMNNSGKSLKPLIGSVKKAHQLIVCYDDLDLPVGTMKISFNRGTGGHRGLESIVKNIKTKEFLRVRIGIAAVTPSGKRKKPETEEKVISWIMGEFKPAEKEALKKVFKKAAEAIVVAMTEGREKAMSLYNS